MGLGTAQYCVHVHMCLFATFSTLLKEESLHIKRDSKTYGQEHQSKLTDIFINLPYDLKIVSCAELFKT